MEQQIERKLTLEVLNELLGQHGFKLDTQFITQELGASPQRAENIMSCRSQLNESEEHRIRKMLGLKRGDIYQEVKSRYESENAIEILLENQKLDDERKLAVKQIAQSLVSDVWNLADDPSFLGMVIDQRLSLDDSSIYTNSVVNKETLNVAVRLAFRLLAQELRVTFPNRPSLESGFPLS